MRPGPHWANAVFIETAALWLDHDILSLQQLNLWHGTGPGWSKGAFIAGWLLPLPCLNTKALFLFQFYSWLPPHLEWLPSRAPQSSLRVESCLVFYQVLQRPDCVPFSSGYNVGLFQEVAEPSSNRLPSGPSHQPRHRELWTLGVNSSWDPPAHAWFLGPGSEIVIGKLTYGVSVLHFISEHRAHWIFPRRNMCGSSPWRSREAVCVSSVRDPWVIAAHCLCSLPHHRHAPLWALPEKPHRHNLLISSYLPTNSQVSTVSIFAFLILMFISRWCVANSMWLLFRMEQISTLWK